MTDPPQTPPSLPQPQSDLPQPPQAGQSQPQPDPSQLDGRLSGLRNPAAAVRGLGAGTLILEVVVLLLAIQPIRVLGGGLSGAAIGAVAGLAGVALLLAGLMRHRWAWHAASALQVAMLAAGLLHWSLAAIGVVFGLVWLYVLYGRKTILG